MCKRFYIKKEYGYVLEESISVFLKYRNTIIYNKKMKKLMFQIVMVFFQHKSLNQFLAFTWKNIIQDKMH